MVSVKSEKPHEFTCKETRNLQFKALFSEDRSLQRKKEYEHAIKAYSAALDIEEHRRNICFD
jgi:hypothetical protein